MSTSGGVISAPVTMTDIRNACGVSGGLGYAITNGTINATALHKPFRSSAQAFVSDAARDSAMAGANYGFSSASAYVITSELTESTWHEYHHPISGFYVKPRGAGQSEWYRMLDFKGYTATQGNPLYAQFPTQFIDGQNVFTAMFNFSSQGGWQSGYHCTMEQMFSSIAGSAYIALSFKDKTRNGGSFACCTGKRISDIVGGTCAIVVTNNSSAHNPSNGVFYAPQLSSYRGDNFEIRWCFTSYSSAARLDNYAPSGSNPPTYYSMEVTTGGERATMTLQYTSPLTGITGGLSTLSVTRLGTTSGMYRLRISNLTIWAQSTTSRSDTYIDVTIRNGNGPMYNNGTMVSSYRYYQSLSLPANSPQSVNFASALSGIELQYPTTASEGCHIIVECKIQTYGGGTSGQEVVIVSGTYNRT